MSITSALSSALSGLTASSRMAEVTSSNVANALTEGYGRREVLQSSRQIGGTGVGVLVNGVVRQVDAGLLRDLRLSVASQNYREPASAFYTSVEATLGTPEDTSSLSGRIAALESALVAAQSRPESDARLAVTADAARSLTRALNRAAADVQATRQEADSTIAREVARINDAVSSIADLNIRIREFHSAGRETTALMDHRQKLIDQVSRAIPVREVTRDHGQIALITTGGTVLLDGRAAELSFIRTPTITPDMTLASGALSGLTINGQAVSVHPEGGRLGEGGLTAQFVIRDQLTTGAQAKLDAVARDLIERFSATGVDPSAAPGAAGLLTDGGSAFVAANEPGVAGRIALNTLVDPQAGGALWRLREGLGAASAQRPGYTGQLSNWAEALSARRTPVSGFASGPRTSAELVADLLSDTSTKRLEAEANTSFASARADALRTELLRDGVDTDQELQNLLLIEQAYAANAKVISTVDDMIKLLLGI